MFMMKKVITELIDSGAAKATKFISEKEIIRAARPTYGGKFSRGNLTVILTVGRPNVRERELIKRMKKAGEGFPVKKIRLEFPTKR